MQNFLAVGAGAALGAWLRWGLALAINPLFASFPLGTWAANLLGGFLMGVVLGLMHAMPNKQPRQHDTVAWGEHSDAQQTAAASRHRSLG